MEGHPSGIPWGRLGIILIALIVLLGGGAYFLVTRAGAKAGADSPDRDIHSGVKVEVVEPKPGGIPRVCTQPGSVEPFERSEIYVKVNGRLKMLKVDIGDRVKAG